MQPATQQKNNARSADLYRRAQRIIPGGVNSPVRAYKAVGGTPPFISSAKGAYVTDVDGQQYIDYVGSWGPMILGHAHPKVMQAVMEIAQRSLSFGAPSPLEVQLAEMICQRVPSIEKVRMVNSGTEATMSAIRLARGATGRNKLIKFEGCYHGHADSLLVKAGSGALTFGTPSSPGVTPGATADTLIAQFNDLDSVTQLFEQHGNDIAAIIVEPIAGNMNMILPKADFLPGLREICDSYGSLLILDEVMTGFRVAPGGVQELYNIKPDITTLGKIIGGGMPVGAFGGRADIMDHLSPEGYVYQAGTLSGNPVAMAAGIATLELLQPESYEKLYVHTELLIQGLLESAAAYGIELSANYKAGMFGLFFTDCKNVRYFKEVMACDQDRFNRFFHKMLQGGIYLAPSSFEAGFISLAHTEQDILETIQVASQVFAQLKYRQ